MRKLVERLAEWLYEYWVNLLIGFIILIVVLAVAGARSTKNRYAEAGWKQVQKHAFVDCNGDSVLIKAGGKHTDIYVKRNK